MKNSMACFGWTLFRFHAKIRYGILICSAHSSRRLAVPISSPDKRLLSGIVAVCQFDYGQLDGMRWLDISHFHAKIRQGILICSAHSSRRLAAPMSFPNKRLLSGIAAVCLFGDEQLNGMFWLDPFSFPPENIVRHSDLFCSFITAQRCPDAIPKQSLAAWNCGSVSI